MTSSVDKIMESFPNPTIPPIVGQPRYDTIADMNLKLNANAVSIQSHLGNRALGLLFITITPAVYNTLSATPFVAPADPDIDLVIPASAIGPRAADIRLQHSTAMKLYKQYDATDKTLKQLLLGAVDDIFIRSLRNRHIGYADTTTLEILAHLYRTYAKINTADLEANATRMKGGYDCNIPIETFFDQIEDAVEFAAAGSTPFTPVQVDNTAFNVIFTTGTLNDDRKVWKKSRHQELVECTRLRKPRGMRATTLKGSKTTLKDSKTPSTPSPILPTQL